MKINRFYLLLTLLCLTHYHLQAQSDDLQHYICTRATEPIVVDGKLDEKSWKKAEWTQKFVDIEGSKKPLPLYDTQVKMLWDENYFYIAAKMYEPHIWATYDKHDMVIFHENDFEVFIDPDGDTHNYYEFEINALNTHWDLMLLKPYRDGGPAIDSWDIKGVKKAVYIDGTLNDPSDKDNYWIVELAFPWEVLEEAAHGRPKDQTYWRVNFSRVNWRMDTSDGYKKEINPKTGKHYPEFNWVWSQQGVISMHQPETWGIVQFSDKPAGTKNIEKVSTVHEDTKAVLREVYYAQRRYRSKHKRYAEKLSDLFDNNTLPKGDIKLNTTASMYEATLASPDGLIWHISQDGHTWASRPRK